MVPRADLAGQVAPRRAANCRYVVAALPGAPLADDCADLVYTGKGALVWMPNLDAWAADIVGLLRRNRL